MTQNKVLPSLVASFLICGLLLAEQSPLRAAESAEFKQYLEKANEYIREYRHFEASDALSKAIKIGGDQHPSLNMRLGILYYGLGLIPQALDEAEKAVEKAPTSKWYKFDLAKLYLVDHQNDKAEAEFIKLLRLDPGFTLGYYYLAEVYFKEKQYDMAWFSLERAKRLGHKGLELEERLSRYSSKPTEKFNTENTAQALFRFIKLSSAEEAQTVFDQIWKGKLFENLELELKKDKSSDADFGVMLLGELKDSVASSLKTSELYGEPVIVRTGPDYRIMQRIAPFDPDNWRRQLSGVTAEPKSSQAVASKQATTASEPLPQKSAAPDAPEATTPRPVFATTVTAADVTTTDTDASTHNTSSDQQGFSSKLAADYRLETWKKAWESQDPDRYFANYSSAFVPEDGQSYAQWQAGRIRSLRKPSFIELSLEDQDVSIISPDQLRITFKQHYRSNTFRDIVIKELTLEKESEGWKITKERVTKKIFP